MDYFYGYILILTLLSFFVMGIDKAKAKRRGARRVPEATLFLLAALGGSVGILLGMYVFRHKTLHNSFRFGIPAIILVQAYLLYRLL